MDKIFIGEDDLRKLYKRLPMKYWERVKRFEREDGLIDNCKFILYFTSGWVWGGDYQSVPVRNITEAISFIKESGLEE